jgi:hypothetical protein
MPWELTGNADATTSSFLGSTNAQPLIIRTGPTPSTQPPERLRVTPDGRIGIGTAAPQARLSVAGAGAIINNVSIGSDGAATNYPNEAETIGLASPGTNGILRLQSPNGLTFHTGAPGTTPEANEKARITADGRVGIGTTGPGANYRLDVAGVVNAADYHKNGAPLVGSQWTDAAGGGISYTAGNVGIGTTSPQFGRVMIEHDSVPLSLREAGQSPTAGGLWRMPLDGGMLRFDVNTAATGDFSSYLTPLTMYPTGDVGLGRNLNVAGNVGVGTTSPGAKLSVAGGGATVNGVAVGTDVAGIDYPWEYETIGVTQTNFNLRLQSPNAIVFHTGDVPTDRMMLTEDGDLVIRKFPGNDTTPSLTRLGLINRSAGGNEVQWALYTAAVGGGWGVNPNAFEIWEYPATQSRFQIRSGGNTILAPAGGNVGVGTTAPAAKLHVAGGDLRLDAGQTLYSPGRLHVHGEEILWLLNRSGVIISQAWGGNGSLYVDGEVRLGAADAPVHIGGNRTGPMMRLNDDLWFSDPQNGTIQIRNHNDSNWGTMVGNFKAPSSIEYKKDTAALGEPDLARLLDDALGTDVVRYRYKGDEDASRLRLGVIAEDCPEYLVGEDGKSLSPTEYTAMLHGAIKALATRVVTLEERLIAQP